MGVLKVNVDGNWVPIGPTNIGNVGARLYDGFSYPSRGIVPTDTVVFWINHMDGTLPSTGTDGAVIGVDIVFVYDPDAA